MLFVFISLQTECDHYRMVSEEAYRQLLEIRDRDILSRSLNVQLRDWLDLMEELKNKVPATLTRDAWQNQTISRLEEELKKCRSDLKSDEEIFAEKAKETSQLHDENEQLQLSVAQLRKQCEELQERLSTHEEQVVEREMTIGELQRRVKVRSVHS